MRKLFGNQSRLDVNKQCRLTLKACFFFFLASVRLLSSQVSVLFPQGALRLSWPMFPWLEVTSGDAEIDRDGELKFSLESRQRLKEQKSKHAVKFANNSSVLFAVIWKPPGQLLLFTDGTICTHTSKSKGGRIKMNYAGNLSYESDKKENPLM